MTALAYWAVFGFGWLGSRDERESRARPLWPLNPWAVGTWALVAVPTLLQVTVWPGLFDAGMRRATAVEHGQFWRLATALTLQDGWRSGAVSNLAILAVTVVVCGPVLAAWRFPAVLLAGGVLANVATIVTHGADGAGNSMATMVTVVVAALLVRAAPRASPGPSRVPGGEGPDGEEDREDSGPGGFAARWVPVAGIVVSGAALVLGGDEHGWAVVIGLALGVILLGVPAFARRG